MIQLQRLLLLTALLGPCTGCGVLLDIAFGVDDDDDDDDRYGQRTYYASAPRCERRRPRRCDPSPPPAPTVPAAPTPVPYLKR